MPETPTASLLFRPFALRGVTLANRIVISPMCQYSARDGIANGWHSLHLGQFALGGAGCVFVEATAVEQRGRITHGCVGLWSDLHAEALKPIVKFVKSQGAAAAIQLAHAGRKASSQRPWEGNGPLGDADRARGDRPWPSVGPTAEPHDESWQRPEPLSFGQMSAIVLRFVEAARRADHAGFDIVELHMAHGYLLHSFLSPLSNQRRDAYGGDLAGRMRFPLEVARAVRRGLAPAKPLFVRISAVDGLDRGWSLDDSVAFAKELKAAGVDLIDCSSGGIVSPGLVPVPRGSGFQVPYAARIRAEAGIATQAVGLITQPLQAEAILRGEAADLVAIGREALHDPYWPRRAARMLGVDSRFETWPQPYGWWLARRQGAAKG